MQRLPGSVLRAVRPGGAFGSLFRSAESIDACSDAACLASRTENGATATLATADGSASGWSLRPIHTAAAPGEQSCSFSRLVAAPVVARRQFATAAQQAAQQQQQLHPKQQGISEVTAVKVVKYLVIGMIIVLTVRVIPYMGVGTVQSALQLLTAESPFLQKAGAQRLSALANLSESGALAAIGGDAIPKLLHLLEHSEDHGVKREVVNAMLELAKVPKGETALLLAEAPLICMLVMGTGDIDDKTALGLNNLLSQLEAAAGKRS